MSVKASDDNSDNMPFIIAGILEKISDMTVFLNPLENSYKRFGHNKAPRYISWSGQNRSQLVRVPAALGEYKRAELRSPDPSANPYLAFALIIYAGLYGIQNKLELQKPADINLYTADSDTLSQFKQLPVNLNLPVMRHPGSQFIKEHIPEAILNIYCSR